MDEEDDIVEMACRSISQQKKTESVSIPSGCAQFGMERDGIYDRSLMSSSIRADR